MILTTAHSDVRCTLDNTAGKTILAWIPGHHCNEETDVCAKQVATNKGAPLQTSLIRRTHCVYLPAAVPLPSKGFRIICCLWGHLKRGATLFSWTHFVLNLKKNQPVRHVSVHCLQRLFKRQQLFEDSLQDLACTSLEVVRSHFFVAEKLYRETSPLSSLATVS